MAEQMEHLAELAAHAEDQHSGHPRRHAARRAARGFCGCGDRPAPGYRVPGERAGRAGRGVRRMAESIDVVFRALQMEALTGSASLTKMRKRHSDGRNRPRLDDVAQVQLQRR